VSTSHVLLGLLTRGERHGYDLKREYDVRFPQARPLGFGQVYATLERLLRDGFVVPTRTERADGPERTSYAVTEEGRAALREWLATVEPPVPFVANALFTKAVVAVLTESTDASTDRAGASNGADAGGAAADYLRAQRAAHLARMREYTQVKTDLSASLGDVLAADYALVHLDADLRWIEAALSRVGALRQEVLS